ncbi:MAG: sugar phosphate nucleotidyltransferase [Bryobacteraceae bacterium]
MRDRPEALILCGGAGSRLKSITGDRPKAMSSIAGRPFLELLLRQLGRHKFQRVILAVGYQQEAIRSYFGAQPCGLIVDYSPESIPLGTGGAIRNAAHLVRSDCVVILNGDSYTDADLSQLVEEHRRSKADVSLVVVPVDGRADCGSVRIDEDGRVAEFEEKQVHAGARYASAGMYVMSRQIVFDIPSGRQVSLEYEVFPQWLGQGRALRAFSVPGTCLDIGTPERYWSAQEVLRSVESGESVAAGKGLE